MSAARDSMHDLSAEKRALLARTARADGEMLQALLGEPIAIVGMACRFPGGADSPTAFWQLLCDGRDAICELPAARALDASGMAPAGYLADVAGFDAEFFGIARREAESLDPQQRILLEVAWEALEDAGMTRDRVAGSATGVFMGACIGDYARLLLRDDAALDAYAVPGSADSLIANRLSYFLDARGPSMAVDTACSSSLVALHLACQSLRIDESDCALAGGVNLILSSATTRSLERFGVLAPDHHCKTLDAAADGFVRAEGCGVLVLRRLADALAAGERVLAVIRGSAVNQDGRSNGITAPNPQAQEQVLRAALRNAGISSERVGYIELHGTGTALGDPIEVGALAAVYGAGEPCLLGALKANVGHMEAAAGVASVIKAVLALRTGIVPRQVQFQRPNPALALDQTRFRIPLENETWGGGTRRYAAVSAMGFGGTNAHVVLEQAPDVPWPQPTATSVVVPISAQSLRALEELTESHRECLRHVPGTAGALYAYARSAALGRTALRVRRCGVGATAEEVERSLAKDAERESPARPAPLAFVFTGQGAAWAGAGVELLDTQPVFRAAVEQFDAAYRALSGHSVVQLWRDAAADVTRTEIAQPLLCALQIGITAQLREWGIEADAVIGHSAGEVAAAWAAGSLTYGEAARVIHARGQALSSLYGAGSMLAAELSEEDACDLVAEMGGELSLAAVNSPTAVTLSGSEAALVQAEQALAERGARNTRLDVAYPFHSSLVRDAAAACWVELAQLRTETARLPIYSTVTGQRADSNSYDRDYWRKNVRQTVRFRDAVRALCDDGSRSFIEIGPHPVLSRPILETAGAEVQVTATLRRGGDARRALLEAVAELWKSGHDVRWDKVYERRSAPIDLPHYPWQHEHFWIPARDDVRVPAHEVAWRSSEPAHRSADARFIVVAHDHNPIAQLLSADERFTRVSVAQLPHALAAHEWTGVLDLTPLESVIEDVVDEPAMRSAIEPTLGVLRAAVDAVEPVPVWTVTCSAAPADGPAVRSAMLQAAAHGMISGLSVERPDVAGGFIDLDGNATTDANARALAELCANHELPARSAIRGGRVFTAVMKQVPGLAEAAVLDATACYAITGGAGALGLRAAAALVSRGARHILLLARHAPAAAAQRDIAALRSAGASVEHVAVDVTDERALRAALDRPQRIGGIIHAAGVIDDGALGQQTWERMRGVLAPKIVGGWNVLRVAEAKRPDFVVYYSSVAALFGGPGQSAYAAGHACLDGYAAQLRAHGIKAVSIAWGPWSGGGMATRVAGERAADGVDWLTPEQGEAALLRVIASDLTSVVIAPIDAARFATTRFRSALLAQSPAPIPPQPVKSETGELAERLATLRPTRVRALLNEAVARLAADVLHSGDALPDPTRGFVDLGMDSLMAMELRARLQQQLGRALPPTIVFDHPTVHALAARIGELIAEPTSAVR